MGFYCFKRPTGSGDVTSRETRDECYLHQCDYRCELGIRQWNTSPSPAGSVSDRCPFLISKRTPAIRKESGMAEELGGEREQCPAIECKLPRTTMFWCGGVTSPPVSNVSSLRALSFYIKHSYYRVKLFTLRKQYGERKNSNIYITTTMSTL